MRRIDFKIATKDWGQTFLAKFRDKRGIHRVELPSGSSDAIYGFREERQTVFLSLNTRLGYAGITVIDTDIEMSNDEGLLDGEELFLQCDHEIQEILGPQGVDLAPATIAKRMLWHLNECRC